MKRASSNAMQSLLTVGKYAGLTVAITVGGVALGAMVIAPVVSRARPMIARFSEKGSSTSSIASTGHAISKIYDRGLELAGGVPSQGWLTAAIVAIAIPGVMMVIRRRANRTPVASPTLALIETSAKAVGGKNSRTPRAVVALAESGATPADIARRTRMPLDAVEMCLSMRTAT